MAAFVNYPLCASDDDEFFDAPAGSLLLKDGEPFAGKVGDGWDWRNAEEFVVQAGDLWASLFSDGNPFGNGSFAEGFVLRVPLAFAQSYDLCEGGCEAREARAEARVAAMFA